PSSTRRRALDTTAVTPTHRVELHPGATSARAYPADHPRRTRPHPAVSCVGETARSTARNRRHTRRAVSVLRPYHYSRPPTNAITRARAPEAVKRLCPFLVVL